MGKERNSRSGACTFLVDNVHGICNAIPSAWLTVPAPGGRIINADVLMGESGYCSTTICIAAGIIVYHGMI